MWNHIHSVTKSYESSSETKLKSWKIALLTDREFKIVVMKKFTKLQENSGRQFSELRNTINEKMKYFDKDIKSLKKKPHRSSGADCVDKWDEDALVSTGN